MMSTETDMERLSTNPGKESADRTIDPIDSSNSTPSTFGYGELPDTGLSEADHRRWPNRWFAAQGLFSLEHGSCAYG